MSSFLLLLVFLSLQALVYARNSLRHLNEEISIQDLKKKMADLNEKTHLRTPLQPIQMPKNPKPSSIWTLFPSKPAPQFLPSEEPKEGPDYLDLISHQQKEDADIPPPLFH